MPDPQEFQQIFQRLRAILSVYEPSLELVENGETGYHLDSSVLFKGKPMFFGAVRQGKQYVSYHLMPIYACPDLLARISPELKKHMQGKSCLNFKHADEQLFAELAELTRAGLARFQEKGMA